MLEVRAAGGYLAIQWRRNGITAGQNGFTGSFTNFAEIYVTENTVMQDLGVYEVTLNPNPGQSRPDLIQFVVMEPGKI